jgi:hypothetical protein
VQRKEKERTRLAANVMLDDQTTEEELIKAMRKTMHICHLFELPCALEAYVDKKR